VVNKERVPQQEGRGRRGYGNLARIRSLIYQRLKGFNDSQLIRHLRANPKVRRNLGLKGVPDRSRISRWKEKYTDLVILVFNKLSKIIQLLTNTELLIADSTPLEDNDPSGKVGFYSRGAFKGFKVHLSVNQQGLPLKAILTTGNKHDSPFLPELLVPCSLILADAGYDSENNRKTCRKIGAKPIIAKNKRRSKKRRWIPKILKKKRYLVEQFNAIIKNAMDKCWQKVKGFHRKTSVVFASLSAILLVSIDSILCGKENLREFSRYRL
jgi:transposase